LRTIDSRHSGCSHLFSMVPKRPGTREIDLIRLLPNPDI
jgi:hypothetical protein